MHCHLVWTSTLPGTRGVRSDESGDRPPLHESDATSPGTVACDGGPDRGSDADSPFREIVEHLEEVIWLTDPAKAEVFYANPAYEAVWGEPRDRLYEEPLSFLDAVHPDDVDRVRTALESQLDGYDEVYRIVRPDGSTRWIRDRAVPIRNADGEVYRIAGIAEDVTERKKREHVLTTLHETSTALLRANSAEEIADIAVDAASETLQLSLVSVYLFDERTDELRPVARTDDTREVIGELPTFSGSGSLAWEAFADGDTRVYDDVHTHEQVYDPETPIRSELVVPLGDHGVLLAGDTATGAFDDVDAEFADLLATATERALDRLTYERHLERQNDRLVELSRLNRLIRRTHKAVVDATTGAEIAANVCETLVAADSYTAAWIGSYWTDEEITVRASAGILDDEDTADRLSVADDTLLDDLIGTAHRTRTVHVIPDLHDETAVDPWHERLSERACRSAVAIPLTADEARYGVLVLYAEQSDVFDEEVIAILRELGQTIGQAFRAAQTRNALIADSAVELKFGVTGGDSFFVAASADLECHIRFEGLVPLGGGRLLYYVSIDGSSPDALRERAANAAAVDSCRMISHSDEGSVLEVQMSEISPIRTLVGYGVTVRSAVADHGDARITVEIAPETNPRTILQGLQEVCPDAKLIGKRSLDRPVRTVQQVRTTLTERLTDKQLNALQAAYFAGYFDWPRESTAEAIADSMRISSSTFHFHLRHALRKLLQTVLDM